MCSSAIMRSGRTKTTRFSLDDNTGCPRPSGSVERLSDVHLRYRNAARARAAQTARNRSVPKYRTLRILPIVPAVVYVEWPRGPSSIREEILAAVVVEDMPPSLCRAAGEALGAVKGSTLADAVVMASAALRGGGIVYTSDVDDLKRLQRHFPTVLVIPV